MDDIRLCCCQMHFAQVHVFKPVASKAGNSEQYLVCLGFTRLTKAHLDKLQLGFSEAPLMHTFSIKYSFQTTSEIGHVAIMHINCVGFTFSIPINSTSACMYLESWRSTQCVVAYGEG